MDFLIGFLVALIIMAIAGVAVRLFLAVAKLPAPAPTIAWGIYTIFCLIVLLAVVTGNIPTSGLI